MQIAGTNTSDASRQAKRQVNQEAMKSGASLFTLDQLQQGIERGSRYLLSRQHAEGYWVFDLEADCTIPAEYLLLQVHLGRPMAPEIEEGIARYLRRQQLREGGWPLFTGGEADISASVKAYFALKLAGDAPDLSHMAKARAYILAQGGAARVNVFTRITLALFGQIPWRTLPAMPVEIMLLPKWFFFHLHKVSYWSRTVIVPLLILYSRQPIHILPPEMGVSELFVEPPEGLNHLDRYTKGSLRKNLFLLLDRGLKRIRPLWPRRIQLKAEQKAEAWTRERMRGEGGIGGIFPAMANAVMALKTLGYSEEHPDFQRGIKALGDLLVRRGDEVICQPCKSPIWDSCLAMNALLAAGLYPGHPMIGKAVDWLFARQHTRPGDWARRNPELAPGGWAFQFENDFYPDVDDTAMVLTALLRTGRFPRPADDPRIARAVDWVLGMQSTDGGWGAYDIDNGYLYLNDIPFADHGALLDPSTSDLTGRCMEVFGMLGYGRDFLPLARAYEFLRREQEPFGGWYGRWGVNYLYGTWSVLSALAQIGEDMGQPYIRKAVTWLKSCQNPDCGWGESCSSYADASLAGKGESTPSQTAWALLGLMAAGEVNSAAVQRGIHFLLSHQNDAGDWNERCFTGTGFPRVFYLRYHGYARYFPLWALGVYRRLRTGKRTRQDEVRLAIDGRHG